MLTSITCFIVATLVGIQSVSSVLPASAAAVIKTVALATTFLLSGTPQIVEAFCVAGGGNIDTHVLMILAALGTLYLGMAHEGALLLLLFQVSHTLEGKFTSRAQGSLDALFSSIPTQATVVSLDGTGGPAMSTASQEAASSVMPGQHATVVSLDGTGGPAMSTASQEAASSVMPGQYVLVKPGEQVPLDGTIVWGNANVSMQHITGESSPVRVAPGASVPAGSLNSDGLLVVNVTATSDDSTPARMARLAAAAQTARPKLQRVLDQVGEIWSKAVIAATLATLVILPLLGVELIGPRGAMYRAMGVLTAGSPCAVVLVPLAYVCAISTITRKGVLVKSAGSLDSLVRCTTVALDKTGTITTGSLTLMDAMAFSAICPPPCTITTGSLTLMDAMAFSGPEVSDPSKISRCFSHRVPVPTASMSSYASVTSKSFDPGPIESPDVYDALGSKAFHYAVALSRVSNHPISRAMVDAAERVDGGRMKGRKVVSDGVAPSSPLVHVSDFEQVPGSGAQANCKLPGENTVQVRFGSLDYVKQVLPEGGALRRRLEQEAMSFLVISPVKDAQCSAWATPFPSEDSYTSTSSSSSTASEIPSEASSVASTANEASGGAKTTASASENGPESAPVSASALENGPATENGLGTATASENGPVTATETSQEDAPCGEVSVAMFSFDDVIQPSVRRAVRMLKTGSWRRGGGKGEARAEDRKEVVMLTGDNELVAQQVANSTGITNYLARLKPDEKLSYVQSFNPAAKEGDEKDASASKDGGDPMSANDFKGLLMMGDGINDAPALAAAHVGVAVADSPSDMVAAAADIIILNGQGVSNLPWLFRMAYRTQTIVRQNLTLALVAVAFATIPTVAGFFPLWLAVLVHEGSTLLVALNSLRLLLDPETETLSEALKSIFVAFKEMFKPVEQVAGLANCQDEFLWSQQLPPPSASLINKIYCQDEFLWSQQLPMPTASVFLPARLSLVRMVVSSASRIASQEMGTR
eukprot:gene27121-2349_t